MQGISKQNGGMRYFFTVINVLFKFAWAIPVHFINANAITATFGQVLTAAKPCHPQRLQTDKGKEFFNSNYQALNKRHGIQHFASESKQRRPWWSDFQSNYQDQNINKFVGQRHLALDDVIQDLVDAYINSRHRSIGMALVDVQTKTRTVTGCACFERAIPTLNLQFRREPWCGPTATRRFLTRGYMPNSTKMHFIVSQAVPPKIGSKRRVYNLLDYKDEAMRGTWYSEEIMKISYNQYRIDKMLRRRILRHGTNNYLSGKKVVSQVQLVDK